jgi:hypothetical protein
MMEFHIYLMKHNS